MSRRGVTLLECLVGMTAASLLLTATCAVLLAAHRAAFALSASLEARDNARAGAAVLRGELRQAAAGELLAVTESSVTLRALRGVATACAIDSAGATLLLADSTWSRLRAIDPLRDSVRILAEGDQDNAADDAWIQAGIAGIGGGVCPGALPGVSVRLAGLTPATLGRLAPGAPVRIVEVVQYRPYADGAGDHWFGTRSPSGSGWSAMSPIAGPLRAPLGLVLEPRDAAGALTFAPDSVALIETAVRVRGRGAAADSVFAVIRGAGP